MFSNVNLFTGNESTDNFNGFVSAAIYSNNDNQSNASPHELLTSGWTQLNTSNHSLDNSFTDIPLTPIELSADETYWMAVATFTLDPDNYITMPYNLGYNSSFEIVIEQDDVLNPNENVCVYWNQLAEPSNVNSENAFWFSLNDTTHEIPDNSDGDINNDGDTNVLDVVTLVNHILDNTFILEGDFNSDTINDVLDVVLLNLMILDHSSTECNDNYLENNNTNNFSPIDAPSEKYDLDITNIWDDIF